MNKLTDDQIFTLAAKSHGCGLSADDIKSCEGEGSAAEFYASELLTSARSIESSTLALNTPTSLTRTMEVCPTCGNKRCPHATDRNLPCTKSNDPGQPGSRYTPPGPPEEKPMGLKDVRTLIANDSFAISFQSLGQYRTYLLKFIDEMIAKNTEIDICDSTESSLSD